MTSDVRAASGWLGSIDDGRADVKVSRVETKRAGGGEEGGYIRLCPGPTLYLALCPLERGSSLWTCWAAMATSGGRLGWQVWDPFPVLCSKSNESGRGPRSVQAHEHGSGQSMTVGIPDAPSRSDATWSSFTLGVPFRTVVVLYCPSDTGRAEVGRIDNVRDYTWGTKHSAPVNDSIDEGERTWRWTALWQIVRGPSPAISCVFSDRAFRAYPSIPESAASARPVLNEPNTGCGVTTW